MKMTCYDPSRLGVDVAMCSLVFFLYSTNSSPLFFLFAVLLQACGYLFDHGCVSLGHACRDLLNKAEQAVTDKCVSRGLRCDTVPFIRHAWMKVKASPLLIYFFCLFCKSLCSPTLLYPTLLIYSHHLPSSYINRNHIGQQSSLARRFPLEPSLHRPMEYSR